MTGFFTPTEVTSKQKHSPSLIPSCGLCKLFQGCQHPKIKPYGEGRRKILIVGEFPNEQADYVGKPFAGDEERLLRQSLAKYDVDLDKDCWQTNALICKVPNGKLANNKAVEWCRPTLIKTIQELQPEIIIPMGPSAVKSVIGWVWKEEVGQISRWDGWRIPNQKLNAWICPTWHPSYILRSDYGSQKENELRQLFFDRHLEAACALKGRPWKKIPDYSNRIKVELDSVKAATAIDAMVAGKRPLAFDFETNMLKPDSSKARIVCCSISDGLTSIAYPWHGAAITATKRMIQADNPKIFSNQKFELRWSMKEFGHGVNNCAWDTMLAAHVIDCRPDITSIKFQAFVLLGVDAWEGKTKDYFKSNGSNDENKIRDMDLNTLLQYCAYDSLYEWKVAMIQAKRMGMEI